MERKVHFLVHKSPIVDPILAHTCKKHLRSILLLSSNLRLGLLNGLLCTRFPNEILYFSQSCMFKSSGLWMGNRKITYSDLNGSKHSPNLICP
jgi:hypothetical protein